jgi:hypothetical protein
VRSPLSLIIFTLERSFGDLHRTMLTSLTAHERPKCLLFAPKTDTTTNTKLEFHVCAPQQLHRKNFIYLYKTILESGPNSAIASIPSPRRLRSQRGDVNIYGFRYGILFYTGRQTADGDGDGRGGREKKKKN